MNKMRRDKIRGRRITKNKYANRKNHMPIIKAGIIAIIVLVMDQLSKYYIVEFFEGLNYSVKIAPFLNIILAQNFGIAFGVLNESGSSYLIPLSIALVTLIGLWVWLLASKIRHFHIPLGLITGGAIGNIIDRFHYGAVTDFIDFHLFGWHYPAFNMADSFICIGVAILIFLPSRK